MARSSPRLDRGRGPHRRPDPGRAGRGEPSPSASSTRYANPANERRAAEIAREVLGPDVYITTSSEILPVWREFERFSTTLVSAYTGPVVERYLRTLARRLTEEGFTGNLLMMLSDGLVETVEYCIPRVVYLIGSGPAAAPSGALQIGRAVDTNDILSVDMGGTSFDICMVRDGEIPTTSDGWVRTSGSPSR